MCDILWSHPIDEFDEEHVTESFVHRNLHGRSYFHYTFKAVCDFLERNRLVSIIRAHAVQEAGSVESFYVSPKFLLVRIVYRYREYRKHHGYPSAITIWSAPNDFDTPLNKAAVLKCDRGVLAIRQFHKTCVISFPFLWTSGQV